MQRDDTPRPLAGDRRGEDPEQIFRDLELDVARLREKAWREARSEFQPPAHPLVTFWCELRQASVRCVGALLQSAQGGKHDPK